jgi:hypothetical protein
MFGLAPNIHYPRKHNHEPLYLGLQSAWFNPNSPCIVMFILIHYKTGFLSHWLEKSPAFPLEFPESKIKKQKIMSAFSIFFFVSFDREMKSKIK